MMLEVILYGKDLRGRLTLLERRFRSLRGLAHFFHSADSSGWEWAEVCGVGPDGRAEFVRYSAEVARAMVVSRPPGPSLN